MIGLIVYCTLMSLSHEYLFCVARKYSGYYFNGNCTSHFKEVLMSFFRKKAYCQII